MSKKLEDKTKIMSETATDIWKIIAAIPSPHATLGNITRLLSLLVSTVIDEGTEDAGQEKRREISQFVMEKIIHEVMDLQDAEIARRNK